MPCSVEVGMLPPWAAFAPRTKSILHTGLAFPLRTPAGVSASGREHDRTFIAYASSCQPRNLSENVPPSEAALKGPVTRNSFYRIQILHITSRFSTKNHAAERVPIQKLIVPRFRAASAMIFKKLTVQHPTRKTTLFSRCGKVGMPRVQI